MHLSGTTFDHAVDPMVGTFTWEGQVPSVGSVLWQITMRSGDGNTVRFLGYKIVDGEPSAQFVFDLGGAWQANPQHDAVLERNRLTARFNPLALQGMGDDWTWDAVLNVNGDDVDGVEGRPQTP